MITVWSFARRAGLLAGSPAHLPVRTAGHSSRQRTRTCGTKRWLVYPISLASSDAHDPQLMGSEPVPDELITSSCDPTAPLVLRHERSTNTTLDRGYRTGPHEPERAKALQHLRDPASHWHP